MIEIEPYCPDLIWAKATIWILSLVLGQMSVNGLLPIAVSEGGTIFVCRHTAARQRQ